MVWAELHAEPAEEACVYLCVSWWRQRTSPDTWRRRQLNTLLLGDCGVCDCRPGGSLTHTMLLSDLSLWARHGLFLTLWIYLFCLLKYFWSFFEDFAWKWFVLVVWRPGVAGTCCTWTQRSLSRLLMTRNHHWLTIRWGVRWHVWCVKLSYDCYIRSVTACLAALAWHFLFKSFNKSKRCLILIVIIYFYYQL